MRQKHCLADTCRRETLFLEKWAKSVGSGWRAKHVWGVREQASITRCGVWEYAEKYNSRNPVAVTCEYT